MIKQHHRNLFSLFIVVQFTSCITSKQLNYLQKSDKHSEVAAESSSFQEYRLQMGDKLSVKVYTPHKETNELLNDGFMPVSDNIIPGRRAFSELNTYLVKEDGTISFPMVGNVLVGGLTNREASRKLEEAIAPFIGSENTVEKNFGSVDVRVTGRFFSVLGDVSTTGYFAMTKDKITLFEALAMAGNLNLTADRSTIRIVRTTLDGPGISTLDLRSEAVLFSEYFYIKPNDVIYVQSMEERFFNITDFPTLLSTTFSTLSFGAFLYSMFFVKPMAN